MEGRPQSGVALLGTGRGDVDLLAGLGPNATVADLVVDPVTATIGDKLLAMMDATHAEGATREPAQLEPFIARRRKLILYHGASDPSRFTGSWSRGKTESSARRRTCGRSMCRECIIATAALPPDRFDTLSAVEAWVEQGDAPDVILASTGRPPGAAPAAAVPLPVAGALSRNGREH